MIATARSIGSLVAGTVLILVGNGLLVTTATLRMGIEAFSPLSVGMVLCAYYAGLTAGAMLLPALIARVGHIRAFAAMAATSAMSVLALPLLIHPAAWMALRGLAGLTMAGIFIVLESWLNSTSDTANRGRVLAVYMIAIQLALAAGQLLVPLYDPLEDHAFVTACALHVLALIPVSLTYIEQPPPPPSERYDLRALVRKAPLGVFGCFISGVVTSSLLTLAPMFTTAIHRSVDDTALFMLVIALSGLVLQWPLGSLSNRIGRRPVMAASCAMFALLCFQLVWWQPQRFGLLLVLIGAVGALAFVIYPLALAYANDLVDARQAVAASSTLLLSFGAGSALGPLASTRCMVWFGPYGLFVCLGAVTAVFAGLIIYRAMVRPAIPRAEWSDFQTVSLPQAAARGQLYVDDDA